MNRRLLALFVIGSVAVALTGGSAFAHPSGLPAADAPGEAHALAPPPTPGPVASRISFQGVLEEGGFPVTGTRDMVFTLYALSNCTSLVDTINKPGVTVEDGLFSVWLNVAHGDFNGQGLWMRLEVGGTTIIDCQTVNPVPYALSLRPGARISDDESTVYLNRVRTIGSPPFELTYKYAVHGVVDDGGTLSYGVYGEATALSGFAYGVTGSSASTAGIGVLGYAKAASGETYGVFGQSDSQSSDARGGYFEGHIGVQGHTTATAGAGVYASNSDPNGADLMLGGTAGRINSSAGTSSDVIITSNDYVGIHLDNDASAEDADFYVFDRDDNIIFNVDDGGTTQVGVLQITGGADLAEPFEIIGAESIEPGMVVAIDPEHAGQLRVSGRAYDRTVAGCVSGANGINPGLTMQQQGSVAEGSLPVALSGRVYCWADATSGPIEPGDLLTTADTPGHAMRVADYAQAQGAILGKAMSALAEGRGLVLVLVALQ